jgi:hypothetical protein
LLPTPMGGEAVFTEEYMDNMVGKPIDGAGNAALQEAMWVLSGNPSPEQLDQALTKIAEIRGMSREEVQAHYEKYLELRADADRIGAAKGKDPWEALDRNRHPEFMGSLVQLRYGQVVGDALGVDPVFGALLNPTGGIVGPGNTGLALHPERALSYHGVFHDAGGYLQNYHNKGPGYDYLEKEYWRDAENSWVGQESGIAYWNDKMGANGRLERISSIFGAGMGFVVDVQETVTDVARIVEVGATHVQNQARDLVNSVGDGIKSGAKAIFTWGF